MDQHFLNSSYREKLIEHLLISELLKISWNNGQCTLEVSKPEVDNQGYDIIVEENDVIRHIQLKASKLGATTPSQKIHTALANKPSGCVIWVYFDENSLGLSPFLFFGSSAGDPLPDITDLKVAKHTKANSKGIKAERPAIRIVNKGQFKRYQTVRELYDMLFARA